MRTSVKIPTKTKPNEYFRLYYTLIDINGKKKKWIGGEHKRLDWLVELGNAVMPEGEKNRKFYITKIVETRVK